MKDRTLLEDLLSYIRAVEAPVGFGRVKTYLLDRIKEELRDNPHEFRLLCSTALFLAERSDTECQPTKPWEKVFEKMRIALNKSKERSYKPNIDPIIDVLFFLLKEESAREESKKLFPFRRQDDKC